MIKASLSIALLSSTFLFACQTSIDPAKVADNIKTDTAKTANMTLKTVTCPDHIVAKAGGTFQCQVTDDQGTPGTFTVTMTDAAGSISWKLDQKYVDMKKAGDNLEASLSQSTGTKVDVKCPDKNVIAKPGLVVVCDATSGDKTQKVTLTGTDADGSFEIAME
jgi:Domain of unknown function (DUF4333)